MAVKDRFLDYVSFWTTCERTSSEVPTSFRQFDLAHELCYELQCLGAADACVTNQSFVYASLPATPGCEDAPALGFICHLDTSPEASGQDVKPQIHENYNGRNVPLGSSGLFLTTTGFPELNDLKGQTLITTDGTTLLGADDKAGIAEVMEMAETVLKENRPHGKLCFAFTPDEEIGTGINFFDLEKFGAEYAYTVDGLAPGEIVWENFNAARAVLEITGRNAHTGIAKGIMINAQLIAAEIVSRLPAEETPAATEGTQGFYHLLHSEGNVEHAELVINIRDHSAEKFRARKDFLAALAEEMDMKYGNGRVTLTVSDVYLNMKTKIESHMEVVTRAQEAAKAAGLTPRSAPTRGGTDGAVLSWRGLPCPNLGIGGSGYHSVYEHITVEAMEQVTEMLLELVRIYSEIHGH